MSDYIIYTLSPQITAVVHKGKPRWYVHGAGYLIPRRV